MAEADPLRKYVEAGIAFTQLTRARAEAIVRELVKAGELHREHTQDRVDELLDRSRKSTEGLVGVVRREIAQQLSSMGVATKDDVDRLAARLDALSSRSATTGGAASTGSPASKKAGKAGKAAGRAPAAKASAAPKGPARRSKAGATPPPATPPPGTAARTAGAPKVARRRSDRGPDAPVEKG